MSGQRHLRRLESVWTKQPVYFLTTCIAGRRPLLANPEVCRILVEELAGLSDHRGWMIGRYVVMPDHVHFFASPIPAGASSLSGMLAKWKEWTAKRILGLSGASAPLWQPEFFDHLMRSEESLREKWDYVKENPVRAGLVLRADDWPYAGAVDFEGG